MSASVELLVGYALVHVALIFLLAGVRFHGVYKGVHQGFRFRVDGEDISPLAMRVSRAHGNSYENLGMIVAVVVAAGFLGKLNIIEPLAPLVLWARVAQSIVHVCSVSTPAIVIRFAFFLMQIGTLLYWIVQLFQS